MMFWYLHNINIPVINSHNPSEAMNAMFYDTKSYNIGIWSTARHT